MTEIKILSVAELAESAFLKQEYFNCLQMMNTPIDYEERKKAFIQMEVARASLNEAQSKLRIAQGL